MRTLSEFRKVGIIDFFPFFMSLCSCSPALIIAFIKSALLYFLIYLMSNDFAILNSSDKLALYLENSCYLTRLIRYRFQLKN
jgi:hypothetical protein